MSVTRVALIGFGRIGRNLFRILYRRNDIRVAAICDVADPAALEYLLRFDTIQGRFPDEVSVRDSKLYTVGREVPIFNDQSGDPMPWKDLGIDVVIAATARPKGRAELDKHLKWGAERVILCTPPADPPDATVVLGVNGEVLRSEHQIIAAASCTANCAAPVVKILDEAFGIQRAFLSTIHAYTNKHRLADVPAEDKRRGRAAAENIIPQETDSAAVIANLLPRMAGKISGSAMNVPVPDGSVVDLVCWHDREVTTTAVNEVMRTAIASNWQGILDYEDDPVVSSDILRQPFSGTYDSLATMAMGNVSKTLTWFDNGWGYSHRVVELIQRVIDLDRKEAA